MCITTKTKKVKNNAIGILPIILSPPRKQYADGRLYIDRGIINKVSPLKIINIERVCKKGLMLSLAIHKPLKIPINIPIIKVIRMAKYGENPGTQCVIIRAATAGEKAIVDSMDRSKFPVSKVKPKPRASIARIVL